MKNGPAMTGQRKIWKDKSKFYNAGGRQLPPAVVFGALAADKPLVLPGVGKKTLVYV